MQRHPNLALTETEEVQETLLTAPSESQIAGAGEGDSPRLLSHAALTNETLTSHALAAFASIRQFPVHDVSECIKCETQKIACCV